ncbi:MAG: GNAT family N-acetyltransferase [Nocardioides sp.]
MTVSTRTADAGDLVFLGEVDRHVTEQELARVVAAGRVLVAEEESTPIGLLRWGMFWDAVPFMNLLFVLPEHRSRGAGTLLVETWERAQAAAGHALVLTSTSAAEAAQHLYRRLGYVDSGSLLLPDEPTELVLRKPLAP